MVKLPQSRAVSGIDATIPSAILGPEPQNPAPFNQEGQIDADRVRTLADQITTTFLNSLPSNYVSQVKGPYYVQQFQSIAEELARIQILATDAFEDSDYDFTRSESLFQFLELLVFPNGSEDGFPSLDGDITYRAFLKNMVALLLQGSKSSSMLGGLQSLTEANFSLLERIRFIGQPGVAWTIKDQFVFDVEVENYERTAPFESLSVADHYHNATVSVGGSGVTSDAIYDTGSGPSHTHQISNFLVQSSYGLDQGPHTHVLLSTFADLPLLLQANAALVLRALDPAHTLYTYRNVLRETWQQVFSDSITQFDLDHYRYDDARRDFGGIDVITGTTGSVTVDRYLFNDPSTNFRPVQRGGILTVTSGPNVGSYRVTDVKAFPFGDDPVPRPYTTSPSGLTGNVTVVNGAFVDPSQNFGLAEPWEILTLGSGPNAGTYHLETLLGISGGPVGIPIGPLSTVGPATSVSPWPSFLQVQPKFPYFGGTYTYDVEVDRLGVKVANQVTNEDVSSQFWGSSGTNSTITVANGPMVPIGGGVVTTTNPIDARVILDGSTPLDVESINPYTGTVTLQTPVSLFAMGAHTITITYAWIKNPTVGFSGLNNLGLVLNKWDRKPGLGNGVHSPTSGGDYGGIVTSKFPMNVVLGVKAWRQQPQRVAHRYMGFDKAHTSTLNSPTSLRLNQAQGRYTVPYATTDLTTTELDFEGTGVPESPWIQVGTLTGSSANDVYTLVAADPNNVGYWGQDFQLPLPSVVSVGARFQIISYQNFDGVFTGVGVGFHDNTRLYLAGALVVQNPVTRQNLYHVGILARPGELSDLSSWSLGPSAVGQIQLRTLNTSVIPHVVETTTISVPTSSTPTLLGAGSRFQILAGTQAGVYTIEDVYQAPTGNTVLVVNPPFPADPSLAGNQGPTLYFETRWDQGPCTWRLYANTKTQSLNVIFGGSTGGIVTIGAQPLASPAFLAPDVLPEGTGRFIWGSFQRRCQNTTSWDFVRAISVPNNPSQWSRGTSLNATSTGDPEDNGWYPLTPFGDSQWITGNLTVTGTPADVGLGTQYGYGYTDPFLNGKRVAAFDAIVTGTRDTAGHGGSSLVLRDTRKEMRLSTLTYRTVGSVTSILSVPTVSLIGSTDYSSQGWTSAEINPPSAYPNGHEVLLGSEDYLWLVVNSLPEAGPSAGRFLEFRVQIKTFTVGSANRIGLSFATNLLGRSVIIDFVSPGIVALRGSPTSSILATYGVSWEDGMARTYRLDFDGSNTLIFSIQNVSLGPTTTLTSYPTTTNSWGVGILSQPDTGSSYTASLTSVCFGGALNGLSFNRTFGLWAGGDPSNINNWVVPRSDSNPSYPNSDPTHATIIPMDWTSPCWVRMFVDPNYGVAFIRPDLDPPAGYVGDFTTESMNPSAGWAVIEYARLPRITGDNFGVVKFGKLNPDTSSVSIWASVQYRLFTYTNNTFLAPQKMVLNQFNVITSGDYLKDTTPERVVIASTSTTEVDLRSCNIFADRVFLVIVEDSVLPSSQWSFNQGAQTLTFSTPLPARGTPVTVVFVASAKNTISYLQSQPLEESQTILNEGTPPVPLGQVGTATISTVSADGGPTPLFPPTPPSTYGYFLRDPYLVQVFTDIQGTLYEQLSFLKIQDHGTVGNITTLDDNSGVPQEVSFTGPVMTEFPVDPVVWSRRAGVSRTVMRASGGSAGLLGIIGPAVYTAPFSTPDPTPTGIYPSMLIPTGPSAGVVPGTDTGAINREIRLIMQDTTTSPWTITTYP